MLALPVFWMTETHYSLWQTDSALCCLSACISGTECQTAAHCQTSKRTKNQVTVFPVKLSDPAWPEQKHNRLFVCWLSVSVTSVIQAEDLQLPSISVWVRRVGGFSIYKCTAMKTPSHVSADLYMTMAESQQCVWVYLRATTCRLSRQVLLPIALLEVHW